MTSFNWLHLTDLHLGMNGQTHLWPNIRDVFFKDLSKLHDSCGPWDAVLFTGDLVQKGSEEEFKKLDELLDQLWIHLQSLGSNPVLLAVPGNHDLIRPDANKAVVSMMNMWEQVPNIHEQLWEEQNSEYREVVKQAFHNYQEWLVKTPLKQKISHGLLPGDFSTTFIKNGFKIGIAGLNTSFLQLGNGDYYKKLACDVRQLHEACDGDLGAWAGQHHACILMTHQPPSWLNKKSEANDYAEINPAGRFATHIFGHMHENTIRSISSGGGNVVRLWQGRSLFGLEHDNKSLSRSHGYSAGRIELSNDEAFIRHWPRVANLSSVNGWHFEPDRQSCILLEDNGTNKELIELLKPSKNINNKTEEEAQASNNNFEKNTSESRYRSVFFKKYQSALLRQCDIISLSGLPEADRNLAIQKLLLRQLYVPLRVSIYSDNDIAVNDIEVERENLKAYNAGRASNYFVSRHPEPIAKLLERAPRLVVLGDPGSGKTTMLRWLATACLLKLNNDPELNSLPDVETLPEGDLLPFIIRCRELEEKGFSFEDIIRQSLRKSELESGSFEIKQFRSKMEEGKLLILVDGLDEIVDITLRAKFCSELEQFSDLYPKAPIIVTSRIVGYKEMRYRIGRDFKHGVIAELSESDKEEFVSRWCSVTEPQENWLKSKNEIIESIRASDRIDRLTGNPMLLTTLALVKRKVGKLPTRRNELYREAIGVLLNWRSELDAPLDSYEALPQLEYIAYEMCQRGTQQLRRDEVIQLLENMRKDYPNIRSVRNRTPEDFLSLLESRTGLIVQVGEKRHNGQMLPVYEFRHLTFQEYLAGLALVEGHFPGHDRSRNLGQRISPLAGKEDQRQDWREAIRLCISCCNDELVDEAMLAVLEARSNKSEKESKRTILAIYCLADEPNVSQDIAMKVINSYSELPLDYYNNDSSDAVKAAKALSNSLWKKALTTDLINRYIKNNHLPRDNFGRFISNINVGSLSVLNFNQNLWMYDQVTKLHHNEVDSILAALSISYIATERKAIVVDGLIDSLLMLLSKKLVIANTAVWALIGLAFRPYLTRLSDIWEPEAHELEILVNYFDVYDADHAAKIHIAELIEYYPVKKACLPLLCLLRNPNYSVTESVQFVKTLGSIRSSDAVKDLNFYLGHSPEKSIRFASAEALGTIMDNKSVDSLINSLDDDCELVQGASAEALGLISDSKAVMPLIKRLDDARMMTTNKIITALGRLRDPRAVEPLSILLSDERLMHLITIVTALWSINDKKAIELIDCLLNADDSEIRKGSFGALCMNFLNKNDSNLLSLNFDSKYPWIDPKLPLTQTHLVKASEFLQITQQEVINRIKSVKFNYATID